MSAHDIDVIWNRALDLSSPADAARPGDRALVTVLTFHGLASNGGLLAAVDLHVNDDVYPIDAVVNAYRYLGLEDAAAAIDNAELELRDLPDDDEEREDAAARIDETYTLSEDDIRDAVSVAVAQDRDDFSPVD